MTKNELIHMANEIFQKSKSQFIQISDDDLCELANAILERAAVECEKTPDWVETRGYEQASKIRSLKLPTN